MKLPETLQRKLTQDWQKEAHREARLCDGAFPLRLAIGLPRAQDIGSQAVRAHLAAWRDIEHQGIGSVLWQHKKYRACDGDIECPTHWLIHTPQDWHDAMDCGKTREELAFFMTLFAQDYLQMRMTEAPQLTRETLALLLRHKALVLAYPQQTVVQLLILAQMLDEGIARDLPLRALTWQHIIRASSHKLSALEKRQMQDVQLDSKFFERHETLLAKLLDLRYGARVAQTGLAAFLGAELPGAWIRLHENQIPRQYLPFPHIRVPAADLRAENIVPNHILIIENEQCLHLLPPLSDTLIILGAGRNLAWLKDAAWRHKRLYYWGDLDSWGLAILGNAQQYQPHLSALMMDKATFEYHRRHAVRESNSYPSCPPALDREQMALFTFLQGNALRLEQEFLDQAWVRKCFAAAGLADDER